MKLTNTYDSSSNSSHQEVKGREITVKWKEEGMWTCKDPSCGKSNFDIQVECVRCKLKRHKWIRSQRCPEIKTATHTCHQCRYYQPLFISYKNIKLCWRTFAFPSFIAVGNFYVSVQLTGRMVALIEIFWTKPKECWTRSTLNWICLFVRIYVYNVQLHILFSEFQSSSY